MKASRIAPPAEAARPPGLHYGDLFAYALATTTEEPLLFKGDDFSKTDVVNALGER